MQIDKVDMYLMTNGKSFPAEQTSFLREKLLSLDEAQFMTIQSTELKNPTVMLIISIFLGSLGVDRFMLGQIGMGILKLLTCGVCGILTIVDWITISKKTRAFNFKKIITALQALGVETEGFEPVASGSQSNGGAAVPEGVKVVKTVVGVSGKSAFEFLKVFVKNPIGEMRTSSLGFNESLLFAGAQILGLAFTALVLSFRGGGLPIVGAVFEAYGSYGYEHASGASRVGLFFSAFFFCAILIVILTAVTLFFGKVIFKGTFGGVNEFKKLTGYVLTAEIPLTLALVVSIVIGLIVPPLAIVLIAAGIFAAVVLHSTVFSTVFGLNDDQSAYATIFTYSVQMLIIVVAAFLVG